MGRDDRVPDLRPVSDGAAVDAELEPARRRRRLRVLAVTAVLLGVVGASLAWTYFAYVAKSDEERARDRLARVYSVVDADMVRGGISFPSAKDISRYIRGQRPDLKVAVGTSPAAARDAVVVIDSLASTPSRLVLYGRDPSGVPIRLTVNASDRKLHYAKVVPYSRVVFDDRPIAYWRLDDEGGRAFDSSRSGDYQGVYAGGKPARGAGAVQTETDAAVRFAGREWIRAAAADVPRRNEPRSVELWFRTRSRELQTLFSYGSQGVNLGFALNLVSNATEVRVTNFGEDVIFPLLTTAADNRWHHLAVAYDGKSVTGYLDGRSIGSSAFKKPLATTPDASGLNIARFYDGTRYLQGWLDEVALYDRALTVEQVRRHVDAR